MNGQYDSRKRSKFSKYPKYCFYCLIFSFLLSLHKPQSFNFFVYYSFVVEGIDLSSFSRDNQKETEQASWNSTYQSNKMNDTTGLQSFNTVILVYDIDSCHIYPNSSRRALNEGFINRIPRYLQEVLERERNVILSIFTKEITLLQDTKYKQRHLQKQLHERPFSTTPDRPLPGDKFHFDKSHKQKFSSQYFKMLHMEIVQVPNIITDADLLDITKKIPCLLYSVMDYTKEVYDHQNSFQQPKNASPQKAGLQSSVHVTKAKNYSLRGQISPPSTTTGVENATLRSQGRSKKMTKMAENLVKGHRNLGIHHSPILYQVISNFIKSQNKMKIPSKINDPHYIHQWYLHDENQYGIDARAGWSLLKESETEVIAIIDTGCDIHHPDLAKNVWKNPNEICGDGIDNDKNGYIDDCYGWDWAENDNDPTTDTSYHGTTVAGLAAAGANNNIGITPVCWNCKFMCLRFMTASKGLVSHQIAAFDYAVSMGARISTNSYGGYGTSKLEYEVIQRLGKLGHLLICSVGNDGKYLQEKANYHTPSSYNLQNILSVGSSTIYGAKDTMSNFGKKKVDVFSPGANIYGLVLEHRYKFLHGTSFAVPIVAGIAAVVWSQYPFLTYHQIHSLIIKGCKPSTSLAEMCVCGGVVNLANTLKLAERLVNGGSLDMSSHHKAKSSIAPPLDTTSHKELHVKAVETPESSPFEGYKRIFTEQPTPELLTALLKRKQQLPRLFNMTSVTHFIEKQSESFIQDFKPISTLVQTFTRWIPITPLTALFFVS